LSRSTSAGHHNFNKDESFYFLLLGTISIALKSGNRDIKELTAHMILVIICEISQEEAKEEVFYETYLATQAHSAQT
jgi:hypothetical protein